MMKSTVHGVYAPNEAVSVIQALKAKGFKGSDITVLAVDNKGLEDIDGVNTFSEKGDDSIIDKIQRFFMNERKEDLSDVLAETGLSDAEIAPYLTDMQNGKTVVLVNADPKSAEALSGISSTKPLTVKEAERLRTEKMASGNLEQEETVSYQAASREADEQDVLDDLMDRQPASDPNADPVSSDTKDVLDAAANGEEDTQLDSDGNPIVRDEQLKNRINTDHL